MGLRGTLRFFFNRTIEGLIIILLILYLPGIPPNAKYSTPYKLPPALPFESKLSLNNKLDGVELWHKGDFIGAESFTEYKGELYTGIHGGDVVKLSGGHITPVVKFGKPCRGLYQEAICGRPLGLKFDNSGNLYVADAYYGIFKVDITTGTKTRLIAPNVEIGGKKPKVPNTLDIAKNGDLYWSDSSTEFDLQDGLFDVFSDGSGRLIHYNAKTKLNSILIDNIHFANGVILSDDEEFILVAETLRNRILRYYLKGPKKGTHDVFIDGLPGGPDNLESDGKGGFLVALIIGVDANHPSIPQTLGSFPLLRKLISRIVGIVQFGFKLINDIYPNEFAQRGVHFVGHFSMGRLVFPERVTILRLSKTGEILDSLHHLGKKISGISEAHIFKDHLYLGTPFNDYIGRIPLSQVGWDDLKQQKATPTPITATPKIITTTPKPTTATPKVTTTTPKPTTTPKITTTTPKPTTAAPKVTATTPKSTTATPKVTTTTPQVAQTVKSKPSQDPVKPTKQDKPSQIKPMKEQSKTVPANGRN